tara:strand:- start:833 stop:1270 length:438 start_codon:yes stop_codon:yes gene_type:complete
MEKIYKNGTKYRGEIKDDKPHGFGTYTNKSGDTYTGEWKNGKRNGIGTWRSNGTGVDAGYIQTYVGEWKDNQMHGKGKYTFLNGDSFSAIWKNGKVDKEVDYKLAQQVRPDIKFNKNSSNTYYINDPRKYTRIKVDIPDDDEKFE